MKNIEVFGRSCEFGLCYTLSYFLKVSSGLRWLDLELSTTHFNKQLHSLE